EKDLASIKTRDFANVDEVRKSLEQFAEVVKSADGDFKKVQSVTQSLGADLAETQKNLSLIDEQIKKDLSNVQQQLNIPQIDAKSLSRAILMKYISDKLGPYQKYIQMAQKYLPEKGSKKKDSPQKEDSLFQPHVRSKGITYEFGHPGSYPLVWIKKVSIQSKAGSTPDSGNLSGGITDITSHQRLIGKPTTIDIQGDFPVQKISRVFAKGQLNQLVEPSLISLKAGAEGLPVEPRVLVASGSDKVELLSASMFSSLDFELKGIRKLNARINNQLSDTEFGLSTSNEVVKTLFGAPLKAIQKTVLAIKLNGDLPEINVDFESDLGTQLEAGVRAQIQAKVNEAKKQVEKAVEEFIGMRKRAIDTQAGVLQDQVKGEVAKVQEQINKIKSDADSRSNEAKRETENKAKKKLEDEGKKLLEDMKKNFKLGN
ncbi:MAG TPA: TIGR03545 family protein, partial [Pseudobdellovibrionaceae bacterium]|nr:TIGR03545 family protein [Pseudobdellovibrionaceae bacterium]